MSVAKDVEHIVSFKLPPKEAIKYIEKKGYKLTFNYDEMMHEAHHKAFTVAKITRLDLLSDIKEAIQEAQKKGLSYQSFKKSIKPTLLKKGWWGDVEVVSPKTGEVKNIFVGDRRLKNIFLTNMRVAYQVQKAKKYYEDENVKYLKYIAVLDKRTRDSHAKLNGTILPKDDEFWASHFPPNGWNCRCRVRAVPAHKKVTPTNKSNLPEGAVHPDWDYDVREGRFFDKFSGTDVETKATANYEDFNLPSASEIKSQNIPPAPPRYETIKDREESLKILKKEILGDKKELIVKTPITEVLIDEPLLRHSIEDNKDNREVYAKYLLPTLTKPDEIWAHRSKDKNDGYFKKRYRFIKLFKEKKDNLLAVSELKRDGSLFWTFFKISNLKQIDKRREGVLMFFNKKLFGE
ncbi:PBECR2 nuclease fold domain-containing protein [Hydrogenimonas thermophila]|uniref:Phage putative head morphogenesis protein, SPP1 gp7 family n=1 Tax=Hydrogenimonas thermophila TaxID=223786 RepID=A0A1I5RQP1_9BACT|nr:PBECR2 nuclease fold domain-containing protein [Hydrogenimonas thermophila]SFP60874.1 phage putative head morphogenesis protein, SPP1 gp7 family [Hydrogenimonas thermophila]